MWHPSKQLHAIMQLALLLTYSKHIASESLCGQYPYLPAAIRKTKFESVTKSLNLDDPQLDYVMCIHSTHPHLFKQ